MARYRLRQLQGLFGEALAGPESRFELEIALRTRRLPGAAITAGANGAAGPNAATSRAGHAVSANGAARTR